jgi:hypothetical protein
MQDTQPSGGPGHGLLGSLGPAPPSPTPSVASVCSADRVWGLDLPPSVAAAFQDKMSTLVYNAIEGLVASGAQVILSIVLIKSFSLHLHLTHQCAVPAES